jgi:hypothetical protein
VVANGTTDIADASTGSTINYILWMLHTIAPSISPSVSSEDCHKAFLLTFHDFHMDSMLHGGMSILPVLHISATINRTVWHIQMCQPNAERLIKLSKMVKGMP